MMNNKYRKTEYETIDLSTYPVDIKAAEKIPKQIALKYKVLAVRLEGSQLTVATWNPMDLYALEDIRLVTNMGILLVLCDKEDILSAIDLYYSEVDARNAAVHADAYKNLEDTYFEDMLLPDEEIEAPVVRLLNSLLLKAYNTNVSDIHMEPYETETVIRMRRDGTLNTYMTLPMSSHRGMVVRTKILAHMDIAEKRRAQDGHFKMKLKDTELNVRVSFVPTVYGEKGVLRFLNTNTRIDHAVTCGMTAENYQKLVRLLKHPHGIIYITGPTGSGKTTTLYSILDLLANEPVNIMTIEDPVERNIPKLNQIQVNERAHVTFNSALRAILRQDPDIIMVGETRDLETASASAKAAITGHLVFSTLHTNNAVSAAVRLQDMGVPGYMVSASVVGIVAQRLVRKVCPYCMEEYEAGERERKLLLQNLDKWKALHSCVQRMEVFEPLTLKRGKGCHLCDGTGYRGRVAVHEILELDTGLRKLITECKMIDELEKYVIHKLNMSTLADEVRTLVLNGVTDMKEMNKVIYSVM